MSLVPWKEFDTYEKEEKDSVNYLLHDYPLVPRFSPPSDYPLDPNNDLLPPGYSYPLAKFISGPPEIIQKRYFSFTIADIREFEKKKNKKWIKVYEKVLGICFRKIRDHVLKGCKYCLFKIPEFTPGFPLYNITHCCAFILRKLRNNSFFAELSPPNIIFISWNIFGDSKMQSIPSKEFDQGSSKKSEENDIHNISLLSNDNSFLKSILKEKPVLKTNNYGKKKEEPFLFR
jgi:hypothetical protein